MNFIKKPFYILMAEDDVEDCMLTEEAFEEAGLSNPLQVVHDGEELLDFLRAQGKYEGREAEDLPGLILLDLNMPKKDGREALKEIKEDENIKNIPVLVLTTSQADQDILQSYNMGASSYITKPVTFHKLVEVIKALKKYWVEIVHLPISEKSR